MCYGETKYDVVSLPGPGGIFQITLWSILYVTPDDTRLWGIRQSVGGEAEVGPVVGALVRGLGDV